MFLPPASPHPNMFSKAASLALLGLFGSVLAAAPTAVDVAHNVSYVGVATVNNTVEKFLNIRYGVAERFANPELAVAAPGSVVNASAQGPVCPQGTSGGSVSEDCLTLKVARPAGVKEGDKLPVMVCALCVEICRRRDVCADWSVGRYLWRWSLERQHQ